MPRRKKASLRKVASSSSFHKMAREKSENYLSLETSSLLFSSDDDNSEFEGFPSDVSNTDVDLSHSQHSWNSPQNDSTNNSLSGDQNSFTPTQIHKKIRQNYKKISRKQLLANSNRSKIKDKKKLLPKKIGSSKPYKLPVPNKFNTNNDIESNNITPSSYSTELSHGKNVDCISHGSLHTSSEDPTSYPRHKFALSFRKKPSPFIMKDSYMRSVKFVGS